MTLNTAFIFVGVSRIYFRNNFFSTKKIASVLYNFYNFAF